MKSRGARIAKFAVSEPAGINSEGDTGSIPATSDESETVTALGRIAGSVTVAFTVPSGRPSNREGADKASARSGC